MIERHYSLLTPRLEKDMLTGKRYELSREEFEGNQDIKVAKGYNVNGGQAFPALHYLPRGSVG